MPMENSASREAPETTSHRRAWYRLHRSTWIALLLLAVLLTIVVVPGEVQHGSQGSYGLLLWLQHGWPWPYLERWHEFPYPTQAADLLPVPSWMNAWAWPGQGRAERFVLTNLVRDILIAGLLLVLFMITFEWGRHRRERPVSQWTLRELLLAVTLLACLLATWQVSRSRLADEETVLQGMRALAATSGGSIGPDRPSYIGPVWLSRLLSCRSWAFQARDTVTYRKDSSPVTAADIEPLLPSLARLKYLDCFCIATDSDVEESALRAIAAVPGITSLGLYSDNDSLRISGDELRALSGMKNLRTLNLSRCLEIRDSGLLRDLTNLERLDIVGLNIDDPRLAFLTAMKNLQSLGLHCIPCDDRAVDSICRLEKLQRVTISHTGISKEAIDRLRAALPDCNTSLCFATPKKPAPSKGTPDAAATQTDMGGRMPTNKE